MSHTLKMQRLAARKLSRNTSRPYTIYDMHGNAVYTRFDHISYHGHSYVESWSLVNGKTYYTKHQNGELPTWYEVNPNSTVLSALRQTRI